MAKGVTIVEQREKLIELIGTSGVCFECFPIGEHKEEYEALADYLLANGVVVSKDTSKPPCSTCNHGWVSASADGIKTCKESCLELKEYAKRKGGDE